MKRIKRHKVGHGVEFVKRNKTYELVYKEAYKTLKEARHREKQVKGWRREKKENLIKYGKPVREYPCPQCLRHSCCRQVSWL